MLANGITLNIQVCGHGPAVLVVHGFPDTSDLWCHQVPALTAAGYRIITMDPRGFGASDKPGRVEDLPRLGPVCARAPGPAPGRPRPAGTLSVVICARRLGRYPSAHSRTGSALSCSQWPHVGWVAVGYRRLFWVSIGARWPIRCSSRPSAATTRATFSGSTTTSTRRPEAPGRSAVRTAAVRPCGH
jgi:pimeloyl-ACP methyl ester carboxylesterase